MKGPCWVIDIAELLGLPVEERAALIRNTWSKLEPEQSRPYRTERQILQARAQEHGIGFVDLERITCDSAAIAAVPRELVTKLRALPVKKDEMTIWCTFSGMPSDETLDCLKAASGCRIVLVLAQESSLSKAIDRYVGDKC